MKTNLTFRMWQHTLLKVTVIILKTIYISKEIASRHLSRHVHYKMLF